MPKIVIVLTRTLGDVILGNILIDEVKSLYPDSRITYICEEKYAEVVIYNPNVGEVLCPPDWDEILEIISTQEWDKIYVPQQTTREDNIWHHVPKYRNQHLVDFYAQRCGIKIKERKLRIYLNGNKDVEIPEPNTIALHNSTLVPSKNWDKFDELCIKLIEEGYKVTQVGLKSDKIIQGAEDLREKFNLNELGWYLSKCDCFVGLDSGLSYLATAVNTPVVCILGATVPVTSSPFGGNVTHILADTREECKEQRCHGNCRFNDPCIKNVSVEQVLNEVKKNVSWLHDMRKG